MKRDDYLQALERRRARLAADIDRLTDLLDCYPSREARRLLAVLVAEIDALDRVILGRRDSAA
jgi:hypothetical protein